jgi:hypothetical protein
MNHQRLPPVAKWLTMSRDQVLDKFMNVATAYTDGQGQERFVFIPGTRSDRALIVAHADTVWHDTTIKLAYCRNILYSANRITQTKIQTPNHGEINKWGIGIGADDRAGCAIAWELRNSGHSILITSGEEEGCIATERLLKHQVWRDLLNTTHTFAIQFDRRGYKDIVFYNVATKEFAKYIKEETGYTPKEGFGTDIKRLCKLICGVNVSVGYYDEHKSDERLVVDQWMNTYQIAKQLLDKKLKLYPLSQDELYEVPKPPSSNNNYHCNQHHQTHYPVSSTPYDWKRREDTPKGTTNKYRTKRKFVSTIKGLVEITESTSNAVPEPVGLTSMRVIECKECKSLMTLSTWFENVWKCSSCGTII